MSDFEFLSVQFEFDGGTYYSLIRKKKKINNVEYHITVMNGELEKLLFGNHIVTQVNGVLQTKYNTEDKNVIRLNQAVTKALEKYLSSNSVEATLAKN
jgi:hypothetical protein